MANSKEAEIWAWLKKNTMLSDEAIAGIMGNMQAESGCEACRVEGDFSSDRSISANYAEAVDAGLKNFADSKGWGLCQWTYFTRKKALLEYCRQKGKSVADLNAQLEYMMSELSSAEYAGLYAKLLTCNDIGTAAELFCRQYERPAELTNNIIKRTDYGKGFYSAYHGSEPVAVSEDPDSEWLRDEIAFLTEERNRLNERIAYYEQRLEKGGNS